MNNQTQAVHGAATPTINTQKMESFLGKVINDLGATLGSTLALIGDQLGLYKAMALQGL